jgi:hypothetical protein
LGQLGLGGTRINESTSIAVTSGSNIKNQLSDSSSGNVAQSIGRIERIKTPTTG